MLPQKAVSIISAPGGAFHDAAADEALFASIKNHLNPRIRCLEIDAEINDETFAKAAAETLLAQMNR